MLVRVYPIVLVAPEAWPFASLLERRPLLDFVPSYCYAFVTFEWVLGCNVRMFFTPPEVVPGTCTPSMLDPEFIRLLILLALWCCYWIV